MLGGSDIEFVARQLVDFGLQIAETLLEILGQPLQHPGVGADAGALHVGQHADQGPFQGLVDAHHAVGDQPRAEQAMEPAGDVRILRRIVQRLVEGHLVEGHLRFARPGHVLELDGLVGEMQLRQLVHAVAVKAALEHVGQDHRVVERSHMDAVAGEDLVVVFDVVPDLEDRRVLEQGLQHLYRLVPRNLRHGLGGLVFAAVQVEGGLLPARHVGDRDVARPVRAEGERNAHQFRLHGIERGGLRVDGEAPLPGRLPDPDLEPVLGLNQLVSVGDFGGPGRFFRGLRRLFRRRRRPGLRL